MKKVKNRALSALILVGITIIGLMIFTVRLVIDGQTWVTFASRSDMRIAGTLSVGTLTDRNGVILADIVEGRRVFAEDRTVRKATLHVVGDAAGNIGTGALTAFAGDLMGYSLWSGTYSRTGVGNTVAMTIDSALNVVAYQALDGRRGAVILKNFETGEILSMVSNPTFDPSDPPIITDAETALEGVFLNRAISSAFIPGSTYKLLTAAAAIEEMDDIFDRAFNCEGRMETERGVVTCPRAHGRINFEQALTASCNIAFGTLAIELGAETLARHVRNLGLDESTTVGGIRTASGNFDQAEPGTADLAWSGVGQYTNTVCPAAMLRFVGAIANDGVAMEMSLIQRDGIFGITSPSRDRIMSSETARKLGQMMDYRIHAPGSLASFPGLEFHAKTGTAEVGGDNAPHAWIVGYITNEGFPLAFAVIVENSGGGFAVAGPVANRVLQAAVN